MAKLLLLISILLFGILLGIQQAEHGILSMEGISLEKKKEVEDNFYIKKIDGDQVELATVGGNFTTQTLEEKQEKWQERYHHNKWSQLGNTLGDLFYSVSRKSVNWFIDQVDKVT